jgi:hypothetical protein
MSEVYEITQARLNALSPTAKAIAENALRYGLWKKVPEDKESRGHVTS